MTTREDWRWRYQHVQAIIVAIDQYANAAIGNRDFLNEPPLMRQGIGPVRLHMIIGAYRPLASGPLAAAR